MYYITSINVKLAQHDCARFTIYVQKTRHDCATFTFLCLRKYSTIALNVVISYCCVEVYFPSSSILEIKNCIVFVYAVCSMYCSPAIELCP